MNGKSDWTAEARQKLGAPPTAEEIEAYLHGELSPEDEERVRALLVCYPELARTLLPPEPVDEELTPEELAADWQSLQKRIHGTERGGGGGGNVLQFWRASAAIAATLTIVFGALLWRARAELGNPRVASAEYILKSEISRGGAGDDQLIHPTGKLLLFNAEMEPEPGIDRYRVELVSTNPGERLWRSETFGPPESGSFSVLVPRDRLVPDKRYRLILYGDRSGKFEQLNSYTFRVAP